MTKRLEEVLNIAPNKEPVIGPTKDPAEIVPAFKLEDQLEEFDKIASALPRVKGLGDLSDAEFDALATKAEQAFDDLMDLGMNVEARYGPRMFEVAANMLNAAINAKSAKIDKKLKIVDLQLKKRAIDKKHDVPSNTVEGQGFILTDRNSILAKLKNMNK